MYNMGYLEEQRDILLAPLHFVSYLWIFTFCYLISLYEVKKNMEEKNVLFCQFLLFSAQK